MMNIYSPLEQFEIVPTLIGFISNFSLGTIWLVLAVTLVFLGASNNNLVRSTSGWRIILRDLAYALYSMTRESIKHYNINYSYYGLILSIFVSLVVINLLGMIPYSFTLTSHMVITFALSFPVWFATTSEAIYRHGLNFLSLFVPAGAPVVLSPLISIIELVSYFSRLFSLAIRLAANLISGHTLVKIIATSTWQFMLGGALTFVAAAIPFAILYLLTILELAVAVLQAYVFTILTCSYLNDAIELH